MPWRWGWPPWTPAKLQDDHRRALEQVERATVDLSDTRAKMARTERVADNLRAVKGRNHFSESMEELFASAPKRSFGPRHQGS